MLWGKRHTATLKEREDDAGDRHTGSPSLEADIALIQGESKGELQIPKA